VHEAQLEDSGSGLSPTTDGWFVVNVRDATWLTSENGDKRPSGSESLVGLGAQGFGRWLDEWKALVREGGPPTT
jgi:hypothetical protein